MTRIALGLISSCAMQGRSALHARTLSYLCLDLPAFPCLYMNLHAFLGLYKTVQRAQASVCVLFDYCCLLLRKLADRHGSERADGDVFGLVTTQIAIPRIRKRTRRG